MAKSPNVADQIIEGSKIIEEIMLTHLEKISANFIDDVMAKYKSLPDANKLNAIVGLKPTGVEEYKKDLLDSLSDLSVDALNLAKKEVPKAKNVKFAEPTSFSKLPKDLQKKLIARNELLIGKQLGDLQKVIEFAYAANEGVYDSPNELESQLNDSAVGWLDGTSVSSGAELTTATIISDAREAFFFEDDVLDEIDAFEFVNMDPVTPICQDLAGTVFDKEDPDLFKYTPPLHWNCKSYIRPILKGNLGGREIEKLKPSSKALEDSIQFHEVKEKHYCFHLWDRNFLLDWIHCKVDESE